MGEGGVTLDKIGTYGEEVGKEEEAAEGETPQKQKEETYPQSQSEVFHMIFQKE